MSESLPHHQHISGVSTENHSQAFVGSARDVYFASSTSPQETLEQAAKACHNALFFTDPYVDRESVISAKGTRVAGTCEWITRNDRFRAWLSNSGDGDGDGDGDGGGDGDDSSDDRTRLLWISGGPGKGKTMMSVYLTEELESYTADMDNANLAFFFCSAEDEKRNTAVAVLRALVHQIVVKRPKLTTHALPYFETLERTQQTLSSLETLWIIFSRLVADAELGTMFCVLDGLDECEESTVRTLLTKLVDLLAGEAPLSRRSMFKLVIVSRDLPGLRGCRRIRLDPDNDEKVASDIHLFVSARVRELLRIEGFDDEFRAYVQTALLERAQGTFLWVGFAMHELLQKQTRSEIWEALEDLPSGLPAIYSRMLLNILAKQREVSGAILRWVTLAVRPLQLHELAAATGVQPLSPQITVEQATLDAIALCKPLVEVQEQGVSLIHQSARDYLLQGNLNEYAPPETSFINSANAHLELTQTCLDCVAKSYLKGGLLAFNKKPHLQESALLKYAVYHWPAHAKSYLALDTEVPRFLVQFFETEHAMRRDWWKAYMNGTSSVLPKTLPLLHMLCYLEFEPLVRRVIALDRWRPRSLKRIDTRDSQGNTALQLATWTGNGKIVRLLVNSRANVDIERKDGKTALHLAAWKGHKVVGQLLVSRGADVNAQDNNKETALHLAVQWGKLAVARLLIDSGADVNAQDNNKETALHLAVQRRKLAVVQLLAESGADVGIKDRDGKTALHLAAWKGHKVVGQLLVSRGADVNAQDNNKETALHLAVQRRKLAVVRLLAESGADVGIKGKDGKTALQFAAQEGHEKVARLLMDSGADVNAQDNLGQTALQLAAQEGHEKVARLLMDSGADVKTKDNLGQTALHLAAWTGVKTVVRLLINRGADISAKNNSEETPLHLAAERTESTLLQLIQTRLANLNAGMKSGTRSPLRENEAVVRFLVDSGADVKAKDTDGKTVLHSAALAWGGNDAVVRLLIDKGVDIEARDNCGKSVLHLAVSDKRDNSGVVRLLIDEGVDIEAKENSGKTALHLAVSAQKENKGVARLLIDSGADIKAKDNSGKTALHLTAQEGHEAVARLLIDSGADIKAKDNSGKTALHVAAQCRKFAVVRLIVDRGVKQRQRRQSGRR